MLLAEWLKLADAEYTTNLLAATIIPAIPARDVAITTPRPVGQIIPAIEGVDNGFPARFHQAVYYSNMATFRG